MDELGEIVDALNFKDNIGRYGIFEQTDGSVSVGKIVSVKDDIVQYEVISEEKKSVRIANFQQFREKNEPARMKVYDEHELVVVLMMYDKEGENN